SAPPQSRYADVLPPVRVPLLHVAWQAVAGTQVEYVRALPSGPQDPRPADPARIQPAGYLQAVFPGTAMSLDNQSQHWWRFFAPRVRNGVPPRTAHAQRKFARKFRRKDPQLLPGRERSAQSSRRLPPGTVGTESRTPQVRPPRTGPTPSNVVPAIPFSLSIYPYCGEPAMVSYFSLVGAVRRQLHRDGALPATI